MNLPTLYKKTSTGAIQMWQISVDSYKTTFYWGGGGDGLTLTYGEICASYGQVGGAMQIAKELIKEGKNIGKVNQTTALEQAELEAQSQWEKKKKKGYVENIDDAQADKIDTNSITGGIEPMLAHTYEKQGHKIKYPAFVQPKLDGHRCIAIIQDGDVSLWSRTRKPITGVPHIAKSLAAAFPTGTLVLDGELYNHDYKDNFEDLSGYIRSETPKPGHEVVQYWIYDVINEKPFYERYHDLIEIGGRTLNQNILVSLMTFKAEDEQEMIKIFGAFVEQGYEGLMVRNSLGKYLNKRSYDLQKVKLFEDAEFKITGVVAGKGKMSDKAIFVLETPEGETFQAKMKGELDSLKKYLIDPETYIGQSLTVQFQGLSNKGIPRFPVGLRIREDV